MRALATARLIDAWANAALRHARTREVDPGVWFADVVGVPGAWGDGDKPDEALAELRYALVGWATFKVRDGDTDIPPIDGVDLIVREEP